MEKNLAELIELLVNPNSITQENAPKFLAIVDAMILSSQYPILYHAKIIALLFLIEDTIITDNKKLNESYYGISILLKEYNYEHDSNKNKRSPDT